MSTVFITIIYNSPAGKVTQKGSFPLRGKLPEQVALNWWRNIKREVFAEGLVSVVINGGEDITDKVKALL